MKILVINYQDDNFGDVLLRICFEKLLEVVLENLNIPEKEYTIRSMALKAIEPEAVAESDLVMFAGGGLFGLSYLNFLGYLEQILTLADEKDVPVIFSSIGVNNMDSTAETENKLRELLRHKCIRAISVRENIELFRHYAGDADFSMEAVCDPAVWTKYVFHKEILEVQSGRQGDGTRIAGINVVRGGLFKDNKHNWSLADEMKYLNALKEIAVEKGYDYRFYTNGSTFDNNTMMYFAGQYNIPDEKLIFVDSTRQFVRAVAGFDLVASIRMHSSIVSYSLGIPVTNLVWNDKVPLFYSQIGRDRYCIPLDGSAAGKAAELLFAQEEAVNTAVNADYLMSLYEYLYRSVAGILRIGEDGKSVYSYETVVDRLRHCNISESEDTKDYLFKIKAGELRYLALFKSDMKKGSEIKNLKDQLSGKQKMLEENNRLLGDQQRELGEKSLLLEQKEEELARRCEEIRKKNRKLKKVQKELEDRTKKMEEMQRFLDKVEGHPVVRLYRRLQRVWRKLFR